jgi:endonuclease YncB( thermonuclease family)
LPDFRQAADVEATKLTKKIQTELSSLILSNRVEVDLNYLTDKRNGLGTVYKSGTNINVALVENGLARVNLVYLKGLPVQAQYALVRAERKAREQQVGIWKQ